MKASEAKTGEKYLTQKGVAVTKTGEKDGKIVMTMSNGMVFRCGPDYELKPVANAKSAPAPKQKSDTKPPRVASLAALIDPMLLSGGHTVKEIAAEITRKAGEAVLGKDVEANVRARLVTYTRKGWRVVKDGGKRVKVVQGK